MTIIDNKINSSYDNGIFLYKSSNGDIINNHIKSSGWMGSIYVDTSTNISINANNLSESYEGIYLLNSNDVDISNNTISDYYEGIALDSSQNITIRNNSLDNSYGLSIHDSYSYDASLSS
jgi:parallel beta-helix repeat protein